MTSARIIKDTIAPLTSENRRNAFIVNDSVYERNRSKKVELLAKVYDHAHGCYLKGLPDADSGLARRRDLYAGQFLFALQ